MQNQARAVRIVTIGLVVLVASMLAYMAWVLVTPIDLPFQRVNAAIAVTSRVDDRILHITGTTNLPDGALIDWYLWREPLVDEVEPPAGQVGVKSGAFAFDADLARWERGTAEAVLLFGCNWGTVQPRHVTDVVGGQCEHLSGEQVYVDSPGDSKQLHVTVRFLMP